MKNRYAVAAIVTCWVLLSGMAGRAEDTHELRGKHLAAELKCKDCHGTDVPDRRAPASRCKECHEGEIEIASKQLPLRGKTGKIVEVNVHASHQGELRCTLCHRVHSPSVLYCNDCHEYDVKVP
jgi:fumarate reductase flavoprotein subunit